MVRQKVLSSPLLCCRAEWVSSRSRSFLCNCFAWDYCSVCGDLKGARPEFLPELKGFRRPWMRLVKSSMRSPSALLAAAAVFIFCTLWFQQVIRSAWCNDESAHIPAGLYHLETGRMDAYRVNPPLPRMIAALPLLIDRPNIRWHYWISPFTRSEYRFADEWVRENASALPRQLFLARSTVLVFFAIGLWAIVRWAYRLYGTPAAWLAGAMWALSPDVICHSAVVAPDLPAAATGLLAVYLFWDWLGQVQRPFPWGVAAAVGFAILCKFSWLFLLVALPVITLAYDLWLRRQTKAVAAAPTTQTIRCSRWSVLRDSLQLIGSFSLSILLINWCYGFDGTGTRLGDFRFISKSLAGSNIETGSTGNRFTDTSLSWLPTPLPSEMIRGIDCVKWEYERGLPCYLSGAWQHRGWWYFHIYAMAVKIPLGYWCLIGIGFISSVWQWSRRGTRFPREWLPCVMAALFLAQISAPTGFTHHVRYVLPLYAFLFLIASRVMAILPHKLAVGLAVTCLLGTVCFHATHLGLAHTFFNPLGGGPNNGWHHLSYSNVDWGQSTYRMVDWVKEHPEQRPMVVLFHSSLGHPQQLLSEFDDVTVHTVDWPQVSGDGVSVPTGRGPGWYLISSLQMTFEQNRYFANRPPAAQPYPDVLLFHVPKVEVSSALD